MCVVARDKRARGEVKAQNPVSTALPLVCPHLTHMVLQGKLSDLKCLLLGEAQRPSSYKHTNGAVSKQGHTRADATPTLV